MGEETIMWWLHKVWYRLFQVGLTVGCTMLPWKQPELLKGPGSMDGLPAFVREKGIDAVLIVTGKVSFGLGMVDGLMEGLKAQHVRYTVFTGVEPNPSIENVEQARQLYLDNNCKGFIAVGGGSAMDCTKAAAARIANPQKSVKKMGGLLKVGKGVPPIFAVPTTAGTGSETTIAAVVTDRAARHKYALSDVSLIPTYALLDPVLTVGLSPHMTATTGMDALTHCVESYLCYFNNPSYAQKCAREGIKLIFENLETAYRTGTDLQARENMLQASYLAGWAFTRTGVGSVHAIAHTLGGLYDTPHGLANAVILPYVLEAYGEKVYGKLAQLADLTGLARDGQSDAEKSSAFIREIRAMNERMEIPKNFDFIKEEDIGQMILWAMQEANPVYSVPVIFSAKEYEAIIRRLRGES